MAGQTGNQGQLAELEPQDLPQFRFYDNRQKYLLFVTTTNEKQRTAERVAQELPHLRPRPPALRLFDAGTGDGTVLSMAQRALHHRYPGVPFCVVAKEISGEDVRLALQKMADRLVEHPQTVLVFTNMLYSEAPWLTPRQSDDRSRIAWREVPLTGTSGYELESQIQAQMDFVASAWATRTNPASGNPSYVAPAVLVLYRADQRFVLDSVIPRPQAAQLPYDLIIASQPFRARLSAERKVRNVLAPLARALAPSGRLVVVQSTGRDPGLQIIRGIWPEEAPFATPRSLLTEALGRELGEAFLVPAPEERPEQAAFTYGLQLSAGELDSSIGTSTLLAAWNAAVYVAQIEDHRLTDAITSGRYLEVTQEVLQRHKGLWFENEFFVVLRR